MLHCEFKGEIIKEGVMGAVKIYTTRQKADCCKELWNWANTIVQQLDDGGSVKLDDLSGFKKALQNFYTVMGPFVYRLPCN